LFNAVVYPECCSARAAGRGSTHQCTTTSASAASRCKISAVSQSQQCGKYICQLKERATRKYCTLHYKCKLVELAERILSNEKRLNSKADQEKMSIKRERAFTGNLESI